MYKVLRATARELRTLLFIGPRFLYYSLFRSRDLWRKELPVQATPRIAIAPNDELADFALFQNWLKADPGQVREGEDSLYLPPQAWARSPIASLMSRYPNGCGIKISKNLGGADAHYNTVRYGRQAQQSLSHPHEKQILLFNFLHLLGVAPRLYDMIELADAGGNLRAAYIVEHVEGSAPAPAEVDAMVSKLKSLSDQGQIHLISGGGWSSIDFQKPDCNGNMIHGNAAGRSYYIDVHNFVLGRYDTYLVDMARTVSADSHFGNKSVLLGGAYLYQELPGVQLPAKRSPRTRMKTYDVLLTEAGVSVEGKILIDVGCNMGLMGAEYLRRGARWLHGFDMPNVMQAATRVLLSIGCTRFSLTGGKLSPDVDLQGQLPKHVQDADASEIILSYLAVREHMGWLPALKALKWRYMIYEGHQHDEPLEHYVAELSKMMPVRVVAKGSVFDANSTRRDSAIIERLAG